MGAKPVPGRIVGSEGEGLFRNDPCAHVHQVKMGFVKGMHEPFEMPRARGHDVQVVRICTSQALICSGPPCGTLVGLEYL